MRIPTRRREDWKCRLVERDRRQRAAKLTVLRLVESLVVVAVSRGQSDKENEMMGKTVPTESKFMSLRAMLWNWNRVSKFLMAAFTLRTREHVDTR